MTYAQARAFVEARYPRATYGYLRMYGEDLPHSMYHVLTSIGGAGIRISNYHPTIEEAYIEAALVILEFPEELKGERRCPQCVDGMEHRGGETYGMCRRCGGLGWEGCDGVDWETIQ